MSVATSSADLLKSFTGCDCLVTLNRAAAALTLAACLGALGWCGTAEAQPVVNPDTVSFTASPDQDARTAGGDDVVSRYDLELFEQGGAQPFLTLDIGKPAPAPDGVIEVDFVHLLQATPDPGTPLQARVAAVGPGGEGVSDLSNVFVFTGGGPQGAPNRPPPAVYLREPANGATFAAPAQIPFYAVFGAAESSAPPAATRGGTDTPSPVAAVHFYANGAQIGVASAPPFEILWQNVPAGTYEIVARAVNASGAQTASPPITITVK